MRAQFELATSNYWKNRQLLDVFASDRWIMALTAVAPFSALLKIQDGAECGNMGSSLLF